MTSTVRMLSESPNSILPVTEAGLHERRFIVENEQQLVALACTETIEAK